jgi:hypothetical protein
LSNGPFWCKYAAILWGRAERFYKASQEYPTMNQFLPGQMKMKYAAQGCLLCPLPRIQALWRCCVAPVL